MAIRPGRETTSLERRWEIWLTGHSGRKCTEQPSRTKVGSLCWHRKVMSKSSAPVLKLATRVLLSEEKKSHRFWGNWDGSILGPLTPAFSSVGTAAPLSPTGVGCWSLLLLLFKGSVHRQFDSPPQRSKVRSYLGLALLPLSHASLHSSTTGQARPDRLHTPRCYVQCQAEQPIKGIGWALKPILG